MVEELADPDLEELDLDNSSLSEPDIIALARAAGKHAALKELSLNRNAIGVSGAEALVNAVCSSTSNLTYLSLQQCKLDDASLQRLASLLLRKSRLHTLALSHNVFGLESVSVWAEALTDGAAPGSSLRRLEVASAGLNRKTAPALLAALGSNTTLTELVLHDNPLGVEGWQALCLALQQNKTLRELDVRRCDLGAGAAWLGTALSQNGSSALQSIDLFGNGLGSALEGFEGLMRGLAHCSRLNDLDLSMNGLGKEGSAVIANALTEGNLPVKELRLTKNDIGEEGGALIGKAMEANSRLEALSLGGNKLGVAGAIAIMDGLQKNQALKQLDLSQNDLSCIALRTVALALVVNKSLEGLNLSGNRIESWGASELAMGLEKNHKLVSLDLSRNKIENEGIGRLAAALKSNFKLKDLSVEGNPSEPEALEILEEIASSSR